VWFYFYLKEVIPISGMNNELRNDEINKKRRDRYAEDSEHRERVDESQKRYRKRHQQEISEQRWTGETCDILLDHADEHKDDDDRLTTDFIADQLKKFKGKIYDKDDLKLLEH
jgi:hypothetical protein